MAILSLAASTCLGFCLIRLLFPASHRLALQLLLGSALGTALLSTVAFFLLFICGSATRLCIFVEIGLVFSSTLLLIYARTRAGASKSPDTAIVVEGTSNRTFVVARFALAMLLFLQIGVLGLSFWRSYRLAPDGLWDAWGIWNLRAHNLFGAGPDWPSAFSNVAHGDYPLLVPLTVVRAWNWGGAALPETSFIISAYFSLLTAGLLFVSLQSLRGMLQASLGTMVLLSTPYFHLWAGSQYADVPLSLYYLATLIIFALLVEPNARRYRWLVVLGMALGAAAWTKNEGLAWSAVVILALPISLWHERDGVAVFPSLLALILGALPLGAALVVLKTALINEGNDLLSGQSVGSTWGRLIEWDRYRLIFVHFLATVPRWTPWIAIWLLVVGVRDVKRQRATTLFFTLTLFGMMLIYFLVYLTTPHDLAWHLDTSIDRLIVQLWPSLLFAIFYSIRTPEEAVEYFCQPAPKSLAA